MNQYLERLEKGEDAKVLLLEASKETEKNNNVVNAVLDRVLEGGDACDIMTDIVNDIIPIELIKTDGNF